MKISYQTNIRPTGAGKHLAKVFKNWSRGGDKVEGLLLTPFKKDALKNALRYYAK